MAYRYTKDDLRREVKRLNNKYCKNTKNELWVQGAYGGVQVQLVGKEYKRGNKYHLKKGAMTGASEITYGFSSVKDTLFKLYEADSKGDLKYKIKRFEPKKK